MSHHQDYLPSLPIPQRPEDLIYRQPAFPSPPEPLIGYPSRDPLDRNRLHTGNTNNPDNLFIHSLNSQNIDPEEEQRKLEQQQDRDKSKYQQKDKFRHAQEKEQLKKSWRKKEFPRN
jgi:hypothetical protein